MSSSEDSSSVSQPALAQGYFRAARWTLIGSLFLMGLTTLTIFTEDIALCQDMFDGDQCQMGALFTAMSCLVLVGLGVFSGLNVRPSYLCVFSVLLLVLLLYKFSSSTFQRDLIRSLLLHMAHLVVLFCAFALSFIVYCGC